MPVYRGLLHEEERKAPEYFNAGDAFLRSAAVLCVSMRDGPRTETLPRRNETEYQLLLSESGGLFPYGNETDAEGSRHDEAGTKEALHVSSDLRRRIGRGGADHPFVSACNRRAQPTDLRRDLYDDE